MEILLQTLAPPSIFGISCIKSVRIWNSGEVNPAKINTFLPTSFQFLASRQRNKWVNARCYPFTSPVYSTPLCYCTSIMIYQQLMKTEPRTSRYLTKFLPSDGQLYWTHTLASIHQCCFTRTALDISWKIAHVVLTTVDRLLKFKTQMHFKCVCGQLETTIHLLLECVDYNIVIQWFCRVLSDYLKTPFSLQPRHVLFGFGPREKYPPAFSACATLYKQTYFT